MKEHHEHEELEINNKKRRNKGLTVKEKKKLSWYCKPKKVRSQHGSICYSTHIDGVTV